MKLRAFLLAALACASLGAAGNARAEDRPSLWDAARDPTTEKELGVRERYTLHVQAMIALQAFGACDPDKEKLGAERAKAMLEAAHVQTSPDPRLRIDLGTIYECLEQSSASAAVLTSALEMHPTPTDAERAWGSLAMAYARMDRPDQEIAAYEKYLELEVEPNARATAIYNMAEAEMRRGRLPDAIKEYREAMRLSQSITVLGSVKTYILAIWGLAVALDRNADTTGALVEAKRAVSHDPQLALITRDPGVFFVPPHEKFYYIGMGELALADDAANARGKREHYHNAFAAFASYEMQAFADDRWLRRAQEHRAFAMKRLKDLGVAAEDDREEVPIGRPAPWPRKRP
jgi:tetratricopeptide (TPR) repeat protein